MKAGSRPQYYRIRRMVQMVREGAATGYMPTYADLRIDAPDRAESTSASGRHRVDLLASASGGSEAKARQATSGILREALRRVQRARSLPRPETQPHHIDRTDLGPQVLARTPRGMACCSARGNIAAQPDSLQSRQSLDPSGICTTTLFLRPISQGGSRVTQ